MPCPLQIFFHGTPYDKDFHLGLSLSPCDLWVWGELEVGQSLVSF